MAVKSGRLVHMMLDQQVLHRIIAFGRLLEVKCQTTVNLLFMFTTDLSFINGGCSTGRNVCFLTMYCRPWLDAVMMTLVFH